MTADKNGPMAVTFVTEFLDNLFNVNQQPNPQSGEYDEQYFTLIAEDPLAGQYGLCGQITEHFRVVYNVATETANGAFSRAAFGDNNVNRVKVCAPWGGGAAPGTGVTRAGVQF